MDIPIGWQLFIQVILIAVNAIFASAEIAIVSMNELKLEKLLNGLKELKLSAVDGLIAQFEQASEDDNGI